MSSWVLHERGEVGEEKKVRRLSPEKQLYVGRNVECGIVLQSKSVEGKHAVFEWVQKKMCFVLRDLNSINGTYVNNRPLRGGHVILKHNDAIRFGYDRDHVYRLEECFSSKAFPTEKTTSSLSASDVPAVCSIMTTTQTISSTGNAATSSTLAQPINYSHAPTEPTSIGVQYGVSTIPLVPQVGNPLTIPYPQSQSPVATFSHSIPINTLQQQSPIPVPNSYPIPVLPSHTQKESLIQKAPPISSIDAEELSSLSHRSDGRRTVGLEQSPSLNKASKLYGQPSWWGEEKQEDGADVRDMEFKLPKPGSQILRQLDHETKKDLLSPKLSAKDELRMQAISNSHPQDSPSSWVIDFSGGTSAPPKMRRSRDLGTRPRSADPSPNRVTARRDLSPIAKRAVTPTYVKQRSCSTSSPTHLSTPTTARQRRAATPPVTRHMPTSPRKPPSGEKSSPKKKTLITHSSKTPHSTKTPHSGTSHSRRSHSETISSDTLHSGTNQSELLMDLKAENVEKNDKTYTAASPGSSGDSFSSLSDQTSSEPAVVITPDTRSGRSGLPQSSRGEEEGKEEEGRSSSARKQWGDRETQAPDSLMLASIEARMRRLGKLAHQTARQVAALKSAIQDGHQVEVKEVDYLRMKVSSPVMTKAEQNLPEWKFFNKEATSIFRNIRVVEKWLQDIDASVSCMKPANASEDYTDYASDGEVYLDTAENLGSESEED